MLVKVCRPLMCKKYCDWWSKPSEQRQGKLFLKEQKQTNWGLLKRSSFRKIFYKYRFVHFFKFSTIAPFAILRARLSSAGLDQVH